MPSTHLRIRRALRASATGGALCVLVALGALAACERPARRDPPASPADRSATDPAVGPAAADVDTFSAARHLPPAPRESSLVASARRTTARGGARRPRGSRGGSGSPRPDTSARVSAPSGAEGAAERAGRRRPCQVERVTDGDTVRCAEGFAVRLLLIDAPEKDQRPFGDQARRELTRLVPPGTRVSLETDAQPRDRYGRLLAYVYAPDGRMANEEMARAGYAVVLVYAPNTRHQARIEAAAADARRAGRGLYAGGGFTCLPREHRRGRC